MRSAERADIVRGEFCDACGEDTMLPTEWGPVPFHTCKPVPVGDIPDWESPAGMLPAVYYEMDKENLFKLVDDTS